MVAGGMPVIAVTLWAKTLVFYDLLRLFWSLVNCPRLSLTVIDYYC